MDDKEVGVRVSVGRRIFYYPCCPDRLCGPPKHLSNGLFPVVRRPGREVGHVPLACAEVKKTRIHTSTPPYAFMA
jgi:hypothetical protein